MWTQAVTYFCTLASDPKDKRYLEDSLRRIASVTEYDIIAPNLLLELVKNTSQKEFAFSVLKPYMNIKLGTYDDQIQSSGAEIKNGAEI